MKVYHPDATSCSVEGKEFKRGKDGSFEVSEEAAALLAPHGFTAAKPAAAAKKEEPKE